MADTARLLALYRTMQLVRQAESALTRLFADGEVPGFIHLSIGQEAIAAGVTSALGPADTLATTCHFPRDFIFDTSSERAVSW